MQRPGGFRGRALPFLWRSIAAKAQLGSASPGTGPSQPPTEAARVGYAPASLAVRGHRQPPFSIEASSIKAQRQGPGSIRNIVWRWPASVWRVSASQPSPASSGGGAAAPVIASPRSLPPAGRLGGPVRSHLVSDPTQADASALSPRVRARATRGTPTPSSFPSTFARWWTRWST